MTTKRQLLREIEDLKQRVHRLEDHSPDKDPGEIVEKVDDVAGADPLFVPGVASIVAARLSSVRLARAVDLVGVLQFLFSWAARL